MRQQILSMNAEFIHQVIRFGLVGLSNVIVDLSIYSVLMIIGTDIISSKALAFVGGTLFAFFVNRSWTFKSQHAGFSRIVPFFILYMFSMMINVSINFFIVEMTHGSSIGFVVAYSIAVLVSSVINFFGMRALFLYSNKDRGRLC